MVKSTVFNFNLTLKVSIQLALMMGAGSGDLSFCKAAPLRPKVREGTAGSRGLRKFLSPDCRSKPSSMCEVPKFHYQEVHSRERSFEGFRDKEVMANQ